MGEQHPPVRSYVIELEIAGHARDQSPLPGTVDCPEGIRLARLRRREPDFPAVPSPGKGLRPTKSSRRTGFASTDLADPTTPIAPPPLGRSSRYAIRSPLGEKRGLPASSAEDHRPDRVLEPVLAVDGMDDGQALAVGCPVRAGPRTLREKLPRRPRRPAARRRAFPRGPPTSAEESRARLSGDRQDVGPTDIEEARFRASRAASGRA